MTKIDVIRSAAKPGLRGKKFVLPIGMSRELKKPWKIILAVSTEIFYILAIFMFSDTLDKAVFLFAVVPVVTFAWLFGVRGGLFGGLITFLINLGTYPVAGLGSSDPVMWKNVGTGMLMIMTMGVGLGWAYNFKAKTREELRNHKEVETALKEAVESERVQRQMAEALRDIAAALTSTLDLESVLDRIIVNLQKIVSYDMINIMLVEQGRVHAVRYQGYAEHGLTEYIEGFDRQVEDVPGFKWMAEHSKPLVVPDTQLSSNWLTIPDTAWVRSFAGIPIARRKEIIGFLNLNSATPDFYQPEFIDRLQPFADQAALAIDNARIFEGERRRVSSLSLLHSTSLDISKTRSQPDLLQAGVVQAVRLLNGRGGALYICDPQKAQLLCKASHNSSHTRVGDILQYGEGAAGRVAETAQPLIVDNYLAWEYAAVTFSEEDEPFNVLSVPVILQGEVLGVVQVARNMHNNPFTKHDAELLGLFANQVAIALENTRLYEEIQQIAIRDALTGLYNRRGLFEVAEREIDRALRYQRPLSLCLLDIDHFKQVNDTYGHLVGDEVLVKLAQILNHNIRTIDVAGRYGGEEFILLAVENDIESAGKLAERLCKFIAGRPMAGSVQGVTITVSIGVVQMSDSLSDLPTLIQAADQALYLAKHSGRNQVRYFNGTLAGK